MRALRAPRSFDAHHLTALAAEAQRLLGAEVQVRARPLAGPLPPLLVEERAAVQGAIEKRVREFSVGRALARELLRELGHGEVPVPKQPSRAPRWPRDAWGSITHTDEVAVVAVGPASVSFGLDLEGAEPLEDPLVGHILRPEEVQSLRGPELGRWAKVVFSAKEAFYKAQHRHTNTLLDFLDVRLRLYPTERRFEVEVLHDAKARLPGRFEGGWAEVGPFVLTTCRLVTPRTR